MLAGRVFTTAPPCADFPFGHIFSPEEALNDPIAKQAFGDEWFEFGCDEYFSFWLCRFERVRKEPLVLIDGAHNSGAVSALAESIRAAFPGRRFTFVLTLLWDRPWKEMLQCVAPLAERFVTVDTADPKALRCAAAHIPGRRLPL